MQLESGEIFGISLLAILIQYLIIRFAVAHGNNSSYRDRQLYIQTMILSEMAKKAGVTEEELKNIYNLK